MAASLCTRVHPKDSLAYCRRLTGHSGPHSTLDGAEDMRCPPNVSWTDPDDREVPDGRPEVKYVPRDAGGTKHDTGKPRLDLLDPIALEEVGRVLTFGATKYDAHNWRKGFAWSRLLAAALRHTFAFLRGEDRDPETGLSHLAHASCCLMFLLNFQLTGGGTDDRFSSLGRDNGAASLRRDSQP